MDTAGHSSISVLIEQTLAAGRQQGGGGVLEGGVLGGAPGRDVPGVPVGGGVSGTSEQLGMRPTWDPTVRTAPSHDRG